MRTLIGLFGDKYEAEANIDDMKRLGAGESDIGVLSPEGSLDLAGMKTSAVDLPGFGRLTACGPITTYLDRATATHAPDVVIGALVQMGVPADDATRYVDGVRHGFTLETIAIDDDKVDEALARMRQHTLAKHEMTEKTGGIEGEEQILPVILEDLKVGKREVATGGVRVKSTIEEIPVEEKIELREENVGVERREVDRPVKAGEAPFKERTIEMIAKSEEPVVSKEARVVEEVVVKKGATERTETIRDTLRKTDVEVEPLKFDPSTYREHYRSTLRGTDEGFDEFEPAYRFGYERRALTPQTDWSGVETSAKTDWEKQRPGTWDRFKDAIRHAWERAKS